MENSSIHNKYLYGMNNKPGVKKKKKSPTAATAATLMKNINNNPINF